MDTPEGFAKALETTQEGFAVCGRCLCQIDGFVRQSDTAIYFHGECMDGEWLKQIYGKNKDEE